jgi:hypothetical protein
MTNYFEWIGAGSVAIIPVGEAMHEVSARPTVVSTLEFGFDLENLYVRVAGPSPMRDAIAGDRQLSLNFLKPEGCRVVVSQVDGIVRAHMADRPQKKNLAPRSCPDIKAAVGAVLELQIPFECLGASEEATVAFIVALQRSGAEVEHHPRHRAIEVQVPGPQFAARTWTV